MANKATKAADSKFYLARMEAAEFNERLSSREGAAEQLGIDRTRLARIELGTLTPYPEEVLLIADLYNAPQLRNQFCCEQCPLGTHTAIPAELKEFDSIALRLLSSLRKVDGIKDSLLDISEDGQITQDEQPELQVILKTLEELSTFTAEMKLYVEKNYRGG